MMKEIEPVAIFHSPFSSKFGIPRQSGLVKGLKGRIVLEPKYHDPNALRGITDFDYLWLIWGFSANREYNGESLTVRPPRLGGNERVGVFASRSPFRPNGLGLSSVRIIGVEKTDIIVSGADLMDGTPIYDIKPYLSYADAHPEASGGFTDHHQWKKLNVVIPDSLACNISEDLIEDLKEVLALDPRPHYHKDPDRTYGMTFNGKDIHFKVDKDILTVTDIITT